MLRFAPSPTGDMHIGYLRVALLNYIVSCQNKEDFIVRIEDTDKEKNIDGKDQEILDLLALFGIEYSQVIYQSENIRYHTAMALQLIHDKKAFSCFCSDDWLDKKRQEAKDANELYLYDDACRNLPAELVIDNLSPFCIRINKPKSDTIDSFIILNQDKKPTYNFSCAVDDMLSDISIIIRDDIHIQNTPIQSHVRASLGYEKEVQYIHLQTLQNDNNLSVKSLLEEGFLPDAISNYLISTVFTAPQEVFTAKEAIDWFSLDSISNSPTSFNMKTLKEINKKHLLNLDAKELSRYVGFADEEIGELARVYLEQFSTTKELKEKIETIFNEKIIPSELLEQSQLVKDTIKKAPYFEKYDDLKKYIMMESGLGDEEFSKSFQLILTGDTDGPDIALVYKYLKNYLVEIAK